MKYKMEWEKNDNTSIASEVDNGYHCITGDIANGYGRSTKQEWNVWVTHTTTGHRSSKTN